jgi:hypothetical protein
VFAYASSSAIVKQRQPVGRGSDYTINEKEEEEEMRSRIKS